MEAYDTAVLSYALATAAHKSRSNALDILPGTSGLNRPEEISLTPPARNEYKDNVEEIEHRNLFYQALCRLEQHIVNKTPLVLHELSEVCSLKQFDNQTLVLLDTLQHEIRHLSKQGFLNFVIDVDDRKRTFAKMEHICKILLELCNKYGLSEGSHILKSYLS